MGAIGIFIMPFALFWIINKIFPVFEYESTHSAVKFGIASRGTVPGRQYQI
jgi:hypothetical protein